MVVPSGIASDDTTRHFFADIVERRHLASLYDFENKGIFPGVHSSYKFCLLTLSGGDLGEGHHAQFVFFAHDVADLEDTERRIELSREDFLRINPNTRTAPIFRSRRDAEILRAIYARSGVLRPEDGRYSAGHNIRVTRMFDMNKQSHLFEKATALEDSGYVFTNGYFVLVQKGKRYVRLIDGKSFNAFDHRYAVPAVSERRGFRGENAEPVSPAMHVDPNFLVRTPLFLSEEQLDSWASGRLSRRYLLAFMDVTSSTNHRTMVPAILPDCSTDYSVRIVLCDPSEPAYAALLCALFASFAFDFVARQKLQGLHLSDYITYQMPVPHKDRLLSQSAWILPRVVELSYTAVDLEPFALDVGFDTSPFRWDPERRFVIRCELDAAFFHLYGIERDDADYIMEQFPIVRRHDEKAYGSYRTKDTILRYYDRMKEAMDGGAGFESELEPPPGDVRATEDPEEE